MPIDFTVTLANFTPAERKNVRVIVKVNGQAREDASTTIVSVPPGDHAKDVHRHLRHGRAQPGDGQPGGRGRRAAGRQHPLRRHRSPRRRCRCCSSRATWRPAARKPTRPTRSTSASCSSTPPAGSTSSSAASPELEQPNLDQYPAIYLFNVPRLSDKARANLEAYVRQRRRRRLLPGRGRQHRLLQPAALRRRPRACSRSRSSGRPNRSPTSRSSSGLSTRPCRRSCSPAATTRSSTACTATTRPARRTPTCKFLLIDRYVPVNRARWNPAPGTADELLTMPNYRSMDDYKEEAQRLLNQIPTDDEEGRPYAPAAQGAPA